MCVIKCKNNNFFLLIFRRRGEKGREQFLNTKHIKAKESQIFFPQPQPGKSKRSHQRSHSIINVNDKGHVQVSERVKFILDISIEH